MRRRRKEEKRRGRGNHGKEEDIVSFVESWCQESGNETRSKTEEEKGIMRSEREGKTEE